MYYDMLQNFAFSHIDDNFEVSIVRPRHGTCRWNTASVENLIMIMIHVHWLGRRDPICWFL